MRPEIGTALPPRIIDSVDPQTMAAWAPILGDPNPIHLDREAVRARGLGDRRINQGPINMAYVMDMLAAALPGSRIARMTSRFLDNAYEGDRLTASAIVTAVEPGAVAVDFTLKAEGRGAVLAGSARIILPE